MQYSLETRVPYLDHRVLEYALNISPDLKFRDNTPKYILKEILYQYVPKQLFDRPKQGFSIPLNKLLKHELKYLIDDYLHPDLIKKTGFVKAEEVKQSLTNFYQETIIYSIDYGYLLFSTNGPKTIMFKHKIIKSTKMRLIHPISSFQI
ncbi:MAG: hypothetical protein IPP46_15645 [Bacteroidetes bacterium]|nr:hypothetical protein [Bacteroidota bacterium]